jgi:cell division protein FtsI (penicillin-binding protein 3)
MAAALDMNVVRPFETFFCENGSMWMGKFKVPDWHRFGVLTVEDILVHSSDIGMAKIGMRLTARLLNEYLMRFGLLDKPGLGLFAEPEPGVRKLSQWGQQYTCFASFGQGVSFSALSLVSGISAIANDGILMQPYILAAVQDADGNIIRRTSPTVVRRVIQANTARTLAGMMRKVVTDGSGRKASVPGVAVCGKTGTAQPFDHAANCYSHEDLITSFAGFAPAEDPKLALLITVFSPRHKQQEIWGSTVAAPIFSAVASHVLAYLGSRTPPFLQLAKNQRLQMGSSVGVGSS